MDGGKRGASGEGRMRGSGTASNAVYQWFATDGISVVCSKLILFMGLFVIKLMVYIAINSMYLDGRSRLALITLEGLQVSCAFLYDRMQHGFIHGVQSMNKKMCHSSLEPTRRTSCMGPHSSPPGSRHTPAAPHARGLITHLRAPGTHQRASINCRRPRDLPEWLDDVLDVDVA